MSENKHEQRHAIKFGVKLGINAANTFRKFQEAFGKRISGEKVFRRQTVSASQ